VELIFDGDGDAVEGPDEAFVGVEEGVEIFGTFKGGLEEWFAETVCLGVLVVLRTGWVLFTSL
jgi:hypothetical protein